MQRRATAGRRPRTRENRTAGRSGPCTAEESGWDIVPQHERRPFNECRFSHPAEIPHPRRGGGLVPSVERFLVLRPLDSRRPCAAHVEAIGLHSGLNFDQRLGFCLRSQLSQSVRIYIAHQMNSAFLWSRDPYAYLFFPRCIRNQHSKFFLSKKAWGCLSVCKSSC